MDRKGKVAVFVAVLVLLVWQIKFAQKYQPAPQAEASPSPAAGLTGSGQALTTGSGVSVLTSGSGGFSQGSAGGMGQVAGIVATGSGAAVQSVPEQMTQAEGVAANYTFTNLGGGIAHTELTGYPAEAGKNVTLNEYGTIPTGAISDKAGEGAELPYTITKEGNTVTATRDQGGGLTITKRFTLPTSLQDAHGYRLMMDVTFTNRGTGPLTSDGYYVQVGSANPVHQRDLPMYTTFDWEAQGAKPVRTMVNWFDAGKIPLVGIETHPERPEYTDAAAKIGWGSVSGQFFTTVIAPQNGALATGVWAKRFNVKRDTGDQWAMEGALKMPGFTVAPGQSVTQTFEIYAGPKFYNVLKGLGDGQEGILNFGWLSFVAVFLLNSMNWLQSITHSYAIAIIVLTLCIRGALWPLQNKATQSMRQMQELTPRMNELKEKYKDDPTRMNTEVMKLYKEYNVNPLAGCLPMVVQLPIFWGFYRVLGTAIELRNSRFLWVHDLSQPDTVFHIGTFPLNVLPLCMAVTMLVQMQLNPKTGDQAQQRMFMFMPLIFVTFCYNYASALALYWTVQNLFSIVQLYVTRKRTAPAPVKVIPPKRRNR